jgi:hypothetical protein
MKANVVKTIIAIVLALLIGVITFTIAPETDYRNWIAFAVTALTTAISLVFAMGIEYNCGYRTVNIKVVAGLGTLVVLIVNIAFSCFTYNIPIYIAVVGIIAVLFFALTYSLIPKAPKQEDHVQQVAEPTPVAQETQAPVIEETTEENPAESTEAGDK